MVFQGLGMKMDMFHIMENHYNIAGRICMDQFMVDFGDTKPEIGDEVLVFGKRKNDFIPVETIAKKINTTTYVF